MWDNPNGLKSFIQKGENVMKEFYIKEKVIQLASRLKLCNKIDSVKLERAISRIEHLVSVELDRSLREVHRHMADYASQAIRKELL
jgi:hypothetical protein